MLQECSFWERDQPELNYVMRDLVINYVMIEGHMTYARVRINFDPATS